MPKLRPRRFNPEMPEANIIAYSLWGDQPRYKVPLMENARVLPHLFPGWTMRVYHDHSVESGFLTELASRGVQLRGMVVPPISRRIAACCGGSSRSQIPRCTAA